MAENIISGLEDLYANLERLQDKVAIDALRFATRKGGQVIQAEAALRAPVGRQFHKTYKGRTVAPGFLSRNVNLRARVDRRARVFWARIGPGKEAFYGSQFVEIGVPSRGIAPRPWLRPALEHKRAEIEQTFVRELRAAIGRAIKRGRVK